MSASHWRGKLENEFAAARADGKLIPTIYGWIELLAEEELRGFLTRWRYIHMIPWPGAFVTLLTTDLGDAPFALALQVEQIIPPPNPLGSLCEQQPPEGAFYRASERTWVQLMTVYLDADTDLDSLLARLRTALDLRRDGPRNAR